jgi:Alcohol acetyltransferase
VTLCVGILEKYHACVHALNFYFNIAGAARYHISTPSLSKERIRNRLLDALCQVTLQHSPMCVSIRGETAHSPAFVRLPSIDISARVTYVDGGDKDDLCAIEKVLEDEHNRPFPGLDDGTGPLWRLLVFEHSQSGWLTVAWVVHHAIADGIGVRVFHATLGEALNSPAVPDAPDAREREWEKARWIICPPHDLAMLDPYEKAVDISPSYRSAPDLLLSLYELCTPSFMHPKTDKSICTGPPFPTESLLPTFRSNHRVAVLSSQVAEGLRRKCRENGTTVSAYLHALMARVIKDVYPGFKGGYAATSPISGRRFAPGAEDQIVDYVSDCSLVVRFARPSVPSSEQPKEEREAEDWANSRRCGKALRAAAKRSRDAHAGHLTFLDDYSSYFKAKLGKPRAGVLKVNSIGLLKKPRLGDWEMDRLIHTVCGGVINSAFVLNVGTVEGGDMGISVAWSEWEGSVTTRKVGDRVMRGIVEGLVELLQLKDVQANVVWTL